MTFDGTGYGTDGAVWGGEFLTGDYRGFRRAAHLRYVAMPGGEQAIREPWRMAAAHLADAGLDAALLRDDVSRDGARDRSDGMIERRFNAPLTSSVGRLFDAVAALAGVRDRVSYEGQAAMELEWLAAEVAADGVYPFEILTRPRRATEPPLVIDTRPLIARGRRGRRGGVAAAVDRPPVPFDAGRDRSPGSAAGLREQTGLDAVVLSGGVFLNALLTGEAVARLTRDGFRVYRHRLVPPNDGGLCLGQLAIAAAWQRSASSPSKEGVRRCASASPARSSRPTASTTC